MRARSILLIVLAAGCGVAPTVRAATSPDTPSRVVVFAGTCDASGAVPIDARLFAVADDENNLLRIYDAEHGGAPLAEVDVSDALHPTTRERPEADLEAATRVGDVALWLSSHARSQEGRSEPDRFRFLSTNVPQPGQPIVLRGPAYRGLLQDLLAEPRLRPFGLHVAAEKAPEAAGGLNIEGMTAMPDGRVLLGFRNPIPDGQALLVALLNPLEPFSGTPLRFGDPVRLDLQGLGVRALSFWHGRYLIAAGHHAGSRASRLYEWDGPGNAPKSQSGGAMPAAFNPEAFFTPEERDEFMVLSDDGSRIIDGQRCKDHRDSGPKRFRGVWMTLDSK